MCVVKYPLGRFGKITVEHENCDFIDRLNKVLMDALGQDDDKYMPIKNCELGVKITASIKERADNLKNFDVVDMLVEFNNCWLMNGKIYTSFVLTDFKESAEKPRSKDTKFSFSDM